MKLFACHYIEVEIELSGTLFRAEPDVGISEPGVEDLAVEGLRGMREIRVGGKSETAYIDLFKGLDAKAQTILSDNLLKAIDEDVVQELLVANADA